MSRMGRTLSYCRRRWSSIVRTEIPRGPSVVAQLEALWQSEVWEIIKYCKELVQDTN